MGVYTGVGAAMTVFGFVFNGGIQAGTSNGDDTSFLVDILMVTLGGSIVLVGLPAALAGALSAHDGVMIEAPGRTPGMASGPRLRWAGPLAPTTFTF
jgi:hypothetical protein